MCKTHLPGAGDPAPTATLDASSVSSPGDGVRVTPMGLPNTPGGVRPTWRQSEIDVGAQLEGQGFRPQVSFKDKVEVPYGTKGSVRPEYWREGMSVEVKNYKLETAAGRARLERNVAGQALQRAENLPPSTTQTLSIDIRGQNVTRAQLNHMLANIEQKSGGTITRGSVTIKR